MRRLAVRLSLVLVLFSASPPQALADLEPDSAAGDAQEEVYDPLFDEPLDEPSVGFPDPAEETNRSIHAFNGGVDDWLLDPLTRVFGWLFPRPVKDGIRRFFVNLGEPATTFNNLLQLEWRDAGTSGSRFLINSSLGIGGIFDVARHLGLDYHRSDFGQTLALAGTPSGSFLMLPLLGPNSVRGGFGALVDITMHPLSWFLGPTNFLIYGIYTGSQGISLRERHLQEIDSLRESSVDYYAALRNAYFQNRMAEIWSRREARRDDWSDE
ncbi:MAG: VacJ family lipoprotein [Myxococcota bacterium]|nr:VacJ family lipoprotein [Myxococcota bacterium]